MLFWCKYTAHAFRKKKWHYISCLLAISVLHLLQDVKQSSWWVFISLLFFKHIHKLLCIKLINRMWPCMWLEGCCFFKCVISVLTKVNVISAEEFFMLQIILNFLRWPKCHQCSWYCMWFMHSFFSWHF